MIENIQHVRAQLRKTIHKNGSARIGFRILALKRDAPSDRNAHGFGIVRNDAVLSIGAVDDDARGHVEFQRQSNRQLEIIQTERCGLRDQQHGIGMLYSLHYGTGGSWRRIQKGDGCRINPRLNRAHHFRCQRFADVQQTVRKKEGRVVWRNLNLTDNRIRFRQRTRRANIGARAAGMAEFIEDQNFAFDEHDGVVVARRRTLSAARAFVRI